MFCREEQSPPCSILLPALLMCSTWLPTIASTNCSGRAPRAGMTQTFNRTISHERIELYRIKKPRIPRMDANQVRFESFVFIRGFLKFVEVKTPKPSPLPSPRNFLRPGTTQQCLSCHCDGSIHKSA